MVLSLFSTFEIAVGERVFFSFQSVVDRDSRTWPTEFLPFSSISLLIEILGVIPRALSYLSRGPSLILEY